MPKGFDMCVKKGGRVRRKSLPGGKYMNICYMDGKAHAGYVHKEGEKSKGMKKGEMPHKKEMM